MSQQPYRRYQKADRVQKSRILDEFCVASEHNADLEILDLSVLFFHLLEIGDSAFYKYTPRIYQNNADTDSTLLGRMIQRAPIVLLFDSTYV